MSSRVLSISKSGGSTTSLCNLLQCLATLTVRKWFLTLKWNFLVHAHCLWSFLWAPMGRVWLHLLCTLFLPPTPPNQAFVQIDKIPLSLLLSRLNSPGSFTLSSYDKCSKPLIIFVDTCWTCSGLFVSLIVGSLELDATLQISSFVINMLLFMSELLIKNKQNRFSRLLKSTRKHFILFFNNNCCQLPVLYLH